MLALSRKASERILIGENIVITIVEIRADKVRLGITAPPEIPIQREEVRNVIKHETEPGGSADGADPGSV